MCGFVGFLSSDEPSRCDLDSWSESIRHRGPDQAGFVIENGFGIGTRRLSIQDLSEAGNQPMLGDRYILGFNGEIYNHHDLREELLREASSRFVSNSDTETVLRAVEHWGITATLERLNGMYAIAIWDKVTQELSLIRDPLGIKPIFYTQRHNALYFASEIKALRSLTSGRVARDGMVLYLYFGFIPAPYSLLEDVWKVQPGERLIYSPSGTRSESVKPNVWRHPESLAPTWTDRVRQVRTEVELAVERQLIADVPVGVFLSGGIDSTIIASVASRSPHQLASFSLNPQSSDQDPIAQSDARLAYQLSKTLGMSHFEVDFHPTDVIHQLETLLCQIDEPVAEPYAIGELVLSRKARSEGIKVVLTGHGGDEAFLGYPTYRAVFRGDLYNKIPFFGPAVRFATRSATMSEATRTNLLGAASIWRKSPLERYSMISGVHFSADSVAALSGVPVSHVSELVTRVLNGTASRVSLLPRGIGDCNAELFARMDTMLMVPEHYNTRLDRMTMAASIEARVPLQDLSLIGFVSQLSHRDLLRGGLKGMLRHAFHDVLPSEISTRPKQTFQAPVLSWMAGPLLPWVNEQVSQLPDEIHRSGLLAGQPEKTTKHAYRMWSLALLEGWRKALALEY